MKVNVEVTSKQLDFNLGGSISTNKTLQKSPFGNVKMVVYYYRSVQLNKGLHSGLK